MSARKWIANTRGRDRTCDLEFRKPTLYPTELRGHAQPTLSGSNRAVNSDSIIHYSSPSSPRNPGSQSLDRRRRLFGDMAVPLNSPDQINQLVNLLFRL